MTRFFPITGEIYDRATKAFLSPPEAETMVSRLGRFAIRSDELGHRGTAKTFATDALGLDAARREAMRWQQCGSVV